MAITFDDSDRTTVAVCDCGWRGFSVGHTGARDQAAEHEASCHPGIYTARNLRAMRLRRHAVLA